MKEGWELDNSPIDTRRWHYFRNESRIFLRLRSLCGGFVMTGLVVTTRAEPLSMKNSLCGKCAVARGAEIDGARLKVPPPGVTP